MMAKTINVLYLTTQVCLCPSLNLGNLDCVFISPKSNFIFLICMIFFFWDWVQSINISYVTFVLYKYFPLTKSSGWGNFPVVCSGSARNCVLLLLFYFAWNEIFHLEKTLITERVLWNNFSTELKMFETCSIFPSVQNRQRDKMIEFLTLIISL